MTETKRFKAVLTTYVDGKLLHKFTAPDDSAEAAVRWVAENALRDAKWADEKYENLERYDERIQPGVVVMHTNPTWGKSEGRVEKIHLRSLRATVRFRNSWRASVVALNNLTFIRADEEERTIPPLPDVTDDLVKISSDAQ